MPNSPASPAKTDHLITRIADLRRWVEEKKKAGQTIGVVPTMGALHEGHLSLVRASLEQTDATIVTIFLNPTQFAPHEDLNKYPKTLATDLAQLHALQELHDLHSPGRTGTITVFAPSIEEMYPAGYSTAVLPPAISKTLEGEKRANHFAGVATVVLKLLNLTSADKAFFGQKDFQQQLVVTRMVEDFNVPAKIIVCPTGRDADGLALSSRNVYLSPEERQIALTLVRTLREIEQMIRDGMRDSYEVIVELRQRLIDGGVTSIDYAVVADPQTLETPERIELPVVVLLAAFVGKTRLIDNCVIAEGA